MRTVGLMYRAWVRSLMSYDDFGVLARDLWQVGREWAGVCPGSVGLELLTWSWKIGASAISHLRMRELDSVSALVPFCSLVAKE